MTHPHLPQLLAEIADVAGERAALLIAGQCGGTSVYFPATTHDNHWLTQLVGREAAEKLCKHFSPGINLAVPLASMGLQAKTRRAIARRLEEGEAVQAIARAIGITRQTVHRHKSARPKGDPRQGKLF